MWSYKVSLKILILPWESRNRQMPVLFCKIYWKLTSKMRCCSTFPWTCVHESKVKQLTQVQQHILCFHNGWFPVLCQAARKCSHLKANPCQLNNKISPADNIWSNLEDEGTLILNLIGNHTLKIDSEAETITESMKSSAISKSKSSTSGSTLPRGSTCNNKTLWFKNRPKYYIQLK